jgi:hypothetical protein
MLAWPLFTPSRPKYIGPNGEDLSPPAPPSLWSRIFGPSCDACPSYVPLPTAPTVGTSAGNGNSNATRGSSASSRSAPQVILVVTEPVFEAAAAAAAEAAAKASRSRRARD